MRRAERCQSAESSFLLVFAVRVCSRACKRSGGRGSWLLLLFCPTVSVIAQWQRRCGVLCETLPKIWPDAGRFQTKKLHTLQRASSDEQRSVL